VQGILEEKTVKMELKGEEAKGEWRVQRTCRRRACRAKAKAASIAMAKHNRKVAKKWRGSVPMLENFPSPFTAAPKGVR
jgi:hypothetical protein